MSCFEFPPFGKILCLRTYVFLGFEKKKKSRAIKKFVKKQCWAIKVRSRAKGHQKDNSNLRPA